MMRHRPPSHRWAQLRRPSPNVVTNNVVTNAVAGGRCGGAPRRPWRHTPGGYRLTDGLSSMSMSDHISTSDPTDVADTPSMRGLSDITTPAALREAAEHARTLIEYLVRVDDDTPIAPELTDRLREVVTLVAPHVDGAQSRTAEPTNTARVWAAHLDRSPVSGRLNPMAPPVRLTRAEDGSASDTLSLGLAYQGPPGRVHGGWVAMLLDHAMGATAHMVGNGLSVTRTLTIDYDDATPLFEEFTVSARVESVQGRKIWIVGDITCAGTVRARARGLWITLPPFHPKTDQ